MVHYDKTNNFYVLLGVRYDLHTFTLQDLITKAEKLYNINVLTFLN